MGKFLLGVLVAGLIGGFLWHIDKHYDTVSPCLALEKGLTASTIAHVEGELVGEPENAVAGAIGRIVVGAASEPAIAAQVREDVARRNVFTCAFDVVRMDFLGARQALVEETLDHLIPG